MIIFLPMTPSAKMIVKWLTYAIVMLAVTATLGGLFIPNLYRDSIAIKTVWRGNDAVTLFLLPFLLAAHHHFQNGNQRAALLWLGLLLYMFYNYAFYLFGAAFNTFFLIYAGLFSLSLYTFLIGIYHINVKAIGLSVRVPLRAKVTSVFLFLVALPLATVELRDCISFIFTGKEPAIPVLVLSLDLTLVIPNTLLSAILLWRGNQWGYVLSAIMLVKSFTYGMVLVVGTILSGATGVAPRDPLLPFYIFICAGGLIFLFLLVNDIKPVFELKRRKLKVKEI